MPTLAYFITWTTYGTWLPGDERGSVGQDKTYRRPFEPPNEYRAAKNRAALTDEPVILNPEQRVRVTEAIRGVCEHRGWQLLAINVRSNHVHVVVDSSDTPEKVMNDFKAWSTRALRAGWLGRFDGRVWTEHGSTRYLFDANAMNEAVDYVLDRQDKRVQR